MKKIFYDKGFPFFHHRGTGARSFTEELFLVNHGLTRSELLSESQRAQRMLNILILSLDLLIGDNLILPGHEVVFNSRSTFLSRHGLIPEH